jgi:mono/diheme cytochrome c family protein
MMKRLSLCAALASACIGGAAWASHHEAEPTPRPPEAVYAQVCGYCHGRNVGPVIRGRGLPASLVKIMVRTGPNAMPAFRPTEISDTELDALANWIQHSEADPEEAGQ